MDIARWKLRITQGDLVLVEKEFTLLEKSGLIVTDEEAPPSTRILDDEKEKWNLRLLLSSVVEEITQASDVVVDETNVTIQIEHQIFPVKE